MTTLKHSGIVSGWAIVAATLWAMPARANETEMLQRAMDAAVEAARQKLASNPTLPVKNLAVLPLLDDKYYPDAYGTSVVQSAIANSSYSVVTRDDAVWKALLDEIKFGVGKKPEMDPLTVQKFGRIQGADGIVVSQIWYRDVNTWSIRGQVKVSIDIYQVETGKLLWSSTPVMGESMIDWGEALTRFWQYPIALAAIVVGLVAIAWIARRIRHAMRPL